LATSRTLRFDNGLCHGEKYSQKTQPEKPSFKIEASNPKLRAGLLALPSRGISIHFFSR